MILEVRLADGNSALVNTEDTGIEARALIVRLEDGTDLYLSPGLDAPAKNSASIRTVQGNAVSAPIHTIIP